MHDEKASSIAAFFKRGFERLVAGKAHDVNLVYVLRERLYFGGLN